MRALAILAVVLTLAACGRRAAPELPAEADTVPRVERFPNDPRSESVPDRDFVLDPILQ